jgi:hypothetical protein
MNETTALTVEQNLELVIESWSEATDNTIDVSEITDYVVDEIYRVVCGSLEASFLTDDQELAVISLQITTYFLILHRGLHPVTAVGLAIETSPLKLPIIYE